MNLLLEFFKPKCHIREKEYISCLIENINNKYIKKIFLFHEKDTPLINSEKITLIKTQKRMTYDDFFKFSNLNLDNQICIIANSDIIFDESLFFIENFDLSNQFLCLTRWDITQSKEIKFYNESFSQDSWIYKAKLPKNFSCPRYLGTPGCDNFVAYEASKSGLITNNPSLLIKTKHLHLSGYRTYEIKSPNGIVEHLFPTDSLYKISKKEYMEI